jgi:hypothetical protein
MEKLAYGKRPKKNLWKLLFCSVQLIVETRLVTAGYFNRRFQEGHGGGPGLAGDPFFQPRLTYDFKKTLFSLSAAELRCFWTFCLCPLD